jgi:hypothetical protein
MTRNNQQSTPIKQPGTPARLVLAALGLCTLALTFLSAPAAAQPAPSATTQVFLPLVAAPQAAPPQAALQNGDFEQGHVAWAEESASGFPLIYSDGFSIPPRSGQYVAWLGGADNDTNRLAQTITLPASGDSYLHYYYQVDSREANCSLDVAQVLVEGTVVAQHPMCFTNNSSEWIKGALDLRGYAGQSVTVTFTMTTDESVVSNLFVDDVSLEPAP